MSGVCEYVEKAPLVILALAGSVLKLGWFNRLKISKRIWRLSFSAILVVLTMLKSHCLNPGLRTELRPQVPIVLGAGMEYTSAAFVIVAMLGSLYWYFGLMPEQSGLW